MNHRSNLTALIMALTLIAAVGSSISAQGHTFKVTSEGEILLINELGAILIDKDGKLTIDMVMGADQRPKEYRDVDVAKNDVIAMGNGKRLKTVADFKEMYEKLAIGDEIKLGMKRRTQMRMVTFAKADPDKLPAKRMMTMTMDGDAPAGMDAEGAGMMTFSGGAGEMIPLIEFGLILSAGDDGISVMKALPNSPDIFGETPVKDGDVLTTINGKPVLNKAAFDKLFEAIEVGEKVTFGFTRGDEQFEAVVIKPKAQSNMIIRN